MVIINAENYGIGGALAKNYDMAFCNYSEETKAGGKNKLHSENRSSKMNRYLIMINFIFLYTTFVFGCVQRPMIGSISMDRIRPIGELGIFGSSIDLPMKETCTETSFAIPKNYVQKWEFDKTNTCDDLWLFFIFFPFILLKF